MAAAPEIEIRDPNPDGTLHGRELPPGDPATWGSLASVSGRLVVAWARAGQSPLDNVVKAEVVAYTSTPFDVKAAATSFYASQRGRRFFTDVNSDAGWRAAFVLLEQPPPYSV